MYEIGKEYYSVGPLQQGGIEGWVFIDDKYDRSRLELGNVFETYEEAVVFKKQIIALKQIKESD